MDRRACNILAVIATFDVLEMAFANLTVELSRRCLGVAWSEGLDGPVSFGFVFWHPILDLSVDVLYLNAVYPHITRCMHHKKLCFFIFPTK
jgi:hypothetical protein